MKIKHYLSFLTIFLCFYELKAQQQTEDFSYTRETTFGVNFNTSGGVIGGINIRHLRKGTHPRLSHFFGLDVVMIKHPKELRSQSWRSGNMFIPGKSNWLVFLRPQYGREIVLFKKLSEKDIQINFVAAAGVTIGLISPYLIDYLVAGGGNTPRRSQYDPNLNIPFTSIIGAARYPETLSSARFTAGGNLKAAFNIEFGSFKNSVTGVEVGFVADFLPTRIIMIPTTENNNTFLSGYVTVFIGGRK